MLKIMILVSALLFNPLSAFAVEEGGACKDDVQKFCKDVKPGAGRIIKCLKEHDSELSSACKEKGKEVKEKIKEFKEACKGDVEKLCKDVKMGGGRIIKCLKANSDTLSPDCKAAMSREKK
jgi:gas vesicle protein